MAWKQSGRSRFFRAAAALLCLCLLAGGPVLSRAEESSFALSLPKEVKNVIRCKNPRCLSSIEQELDQIFMLTDEKNKTYRCLYCEGKANV